MNYLCFSHFCDLHTQPRRILHEEFACPHTTITMDTIVDTTSIDSPSDSTSSSRSVSQSSCSSFATSSTSSSRSVSPDTDFTQVEPYIIARLQEGIDETEIAAAAITVIGRGNNALVLGAPWHVVLQRDATRGEWSSTESLPPPAKKLCTESRGSADKDGLAKSPSCPPNEFVALKCVAKESSHTKREVRVLSQDSEGAVPKLLRTIDTFVERDSTTFSLVAMELLGPDVFDVSGAYSLSEADIAVLGLEMLNTVHRLHSSQGVVHRSVKPENFCFTARESASNESFLKLIDFGRATSSVERYERPYTGWWYSNRSFLGAPQSQKDDLMSVVHSIGFLLEDMSDEDSGSECSDDSSKQSYTSWRKRTYRRLKRCYRAAKRDLLRQLGNEKSMRNRDRRKMAADEAYRRFSEKGEIPLPFPMAAWWCEMLARAQVDVDDSTVSSDAMFHTLHHLLVVAVTNMQVADSEGACGLDDFITNTLRDIRELMLRYCRKVNHVCLRNIPE